MAESLCLSLSYYKSAPVDVGQAAVGLNGQLLLYIGPGLVGQPGQSSLIRSISAETEKIFFHHMTKAQHNLTSWGNFPHF